MDLALIVTCHGSVAPACLSDLRGAERLFREIIFVCAEIAPWQAPLKLRVHFVQSPWGSRNRSRNAGVAAARSSLVYLLDEDVHLPSEATLRVAFSLVKNDVHGAAGPYGSARTSSLWARSYNQLANAWAREGRFLAGHVILRKDVARFDETLLDGGEEERLLDMLPAGARLAWSEGFLAEHERSMSFVEFVQKAWRHGVSRRRTSKDSRSRALKGLSQLTARGWPLAFLFQGLVEFGALLKSIPGADILTKTRRTRERSPESRFRADGRTP